MATSTIIENVIADLPEKIQLVYVDYRDQLTEDQIKALLTGDMETVWESLSDFESESQHYGVQNLWNEALSGLDPEDRDTLREDDEAFDRFQEACWDRDESDALGDLMRNTPNVQIRYYLDHDVEPYPYLEGEDEIAERAQEIAEVAGIDFAANERALTSLVIEASYGGSLCVLHNTTIEDAMKIAQGATVTFTDPNLLVYDGLNGSGSSEDVSGEVTINVKPGEGMRLDVGSYSWSDGIAGVVHSYYDTPIRIVAETHYPCPYCGTRLGKDQVNDEGINECPSCQTLSEVPA